MIREEGRLKYKGKMMWEGKRGGIVPHFTDE